jgi:arylsulfatase A
MPDDACLDSQNIISALLGAEDGDGRGELVQQDNGTKGGKADFGFRSGDWKLIRRTSKSKQQATISKRPMPELKGIHSLYFLPDDPAESKDVGKENPGKLKELIERLDAIIAAGRTRS